MNDVQLKKALDLHCIYPVKEVLDRCKLKVDYTFVFHLFFATPIEHIIKFVFSYFLFIS